MKKEKITLFIKSILFIVTLLLYQISNSQCVNGNSTQDFCDVDNATINDIVVTGGISVVWYDSPTGGSQIDPTTPLNDGDMFYATDSDSSCTDTTRFEVNINVYGEPPSNVDVFVGKCADENSTISDLAASGSNIEWYDAQVNGNLLNPSELLVDGQQYWVQQTENGCTSQRLPTTVTIIDPLPPVVEENQEFCYPPNPTVADLQVTGTGILWYNTQSSTTPLDPNTLLIDGEDYWATQTTFPCESTARVVVNVTLDPAPNAGTDGSINICEIDTDTVNLFDELSNSPDTNGTWSGPDTLAGGYLGTFDPTTNTPGNYTYTVASTGTSGICPDDMSTVAVAIIVIPEPTTSETDQSFCIVDFPPSGPTIGDLNASGNGILWYGSESSTTPLDSSDLLIDGEDYWASQTDATSNCESLNRLVVNVTINDPLPPTTTESNQTFCLVDFTPNSPTVGDLTASGNDISWYDSETSTTPLDSSDLLIDGEDYWASDTNTTSGCESSTRLLVNVSIIDVTPPTTTETTQTFCIIDFTPNSPTIGDLNTNETNVAWYDTETSTTQLNETDELVNGEDYWASLIDPGAGCESSTRLQITVIVNDPPIPTTTNTNQSFCLSDFLPTGPTIGDLEVTGTTITWFDTESSTTPLDSSEVLIDGEDYWAAENDNSTGCESSTRLVVTVTINNPPSPTIDETDQTFCSIDNPTIGDINATGGEILWYDTDMSDTPLDSTDSLIDGEDYWATQVDPSTGCESIPRIIVNATIVDPLPPTTTETTQSFCVVDFPPNGPTVANLDATGNGIQWYASETDTNPLDETELLIDGEDYWATQSDVTSGCESPNRLVVTAIVNDTNPPTTNESDQEFCLSDFNPDAPTIADLNITGGSVNWYDSESSTTPLNLTDALIDGEDYWATDTDTTTGCESSTRLVINVSIINPAPPTVSSSSQSFCIVNNPTIENIDIEGNNILWYDSDTSTTPLDSSEGLVDGEDYWATQSDTDSGCESIPRIQVTVTLNDISPPTTMSVDQTFCAADLPTINELEIVGTNIVWYESETDTVPIEATELLIDGEDYWAAQSDTTIECESSSRIVINAILTDAGTPTISEEDAVFCQLDEPPASINDLDTSITTNGGTVTWYDDYPNGNELNLTDLLTDQTTYYAIETDSEGCSSLNPLAITVTFDCSSDEYDIEIYDGFSPDGDNDNNTFVIKDIRVLYPDFNIEIFNRWGNSVYVGNSNTPDWNGQLNGNGKLVPAGVYYYILHFNKDNRKPKQGRLYLSR
ncbi:gliding motility-associated C-terminal domain-containing protein [Urechidicola croceus]|uniref:Ig-like domain-containing protein n=1 Tax=Urechidicola croceus TaxID=1850246 RepID=A0A1D8PB21_9FLAO|nr:gliding motility-associated C-terminal domain-containing protein [Urechidicola croceus]AOW21769.1 hypothetical protein LPB138_14260 [Urechidicola croceus]